jgi:hypothetical protein
MNKFMRSLGKIMVGFFLLIPIFWGEAQSNNIHSSDIQIGENVKIYTFYKTGRIIIKVPFGIGSGILVVTQTADGNIIAQKVLDVGYNTNLPKPTWGEKGWVETISSRGHSHIGDRIKWGLFYKGSFYYGLSIELEDNFKENRILFIHTSGGQVQIKPVISDVDRTQFDFDVDISEEVREKKVIKQSILKILQTKFGEVPEQTNTKLSLVMSLEHLYLLLEKAALTQSLDDFLRFLEDIRE